MYFLQGRGGGGRPLGTALPSLFTNGKEKGRLSQESLYTFYRFSLSLPAYITEYNYVAPGIMIVGIGPNCKLSGPYASRIALLGVACKLMMPPNRCATVFVLYAGFSFWFISLEAPSPQLKPSFNCGEDVPHPSARQLPGSAHLRYVLDDASNALAATYAGRCYTVLEVIAPQLIHQGDGQTSASCRQGMAEIYTSGILLSSHSLVVKQ